MTKWNGKQYIEEIEEADLPAIDTWVLEALKVDLLRLIQNVRSGFIADEQKSVIFGLLKNVESELRTRAIQESGAVVLDDMALDDVLSYVEKRVLDTTDDLQLVAQIRDARQRHRRGERL